MAEIKTKATDSAVEDYLATIDHPQRKADVLALDALFRRVTGFAPRMWGSSIVGYGRYCYRYESGHSGEMCATGFSSRMASLVIYILPGYANFDPLLARLGKHKLGKSCLYINRLSDIDPAVLEEVIRAGLANLAIRWDVHPG